MGAATEIAGVTASVVVAAQRVKIPISSERVSALARLVLRAERVRAALISIAFVSSRTIARLNRTHLGHRGATNVIAFAFRRGSGDTGLVGDIYIAPEVARRNALRLGVPQRQEIARLVVHGVLHVVGHDHPDGPARMDSPMWRRQEALLRRAGSART